MGTVAFGTAVARPSERDPLRPQEAVLASQLMADEGDDDEGSQPAARRAAGIGGFDARGPGGLPGALGEGSSRGGGLGRPAHQVRVRASGQVCRSMYRVRRRARILRRRRCSRRWNDRKSDHQEQCNEDRSGCLHWDTPDELILRLRTIEDDLEVLRERCASRFPTNRNAARDAKAATPVPPSRVVSLRSDSSTLSRSWVNALSTFDRDFAGVASCDIRTTTYLRPLVLYVPSSRVCPACC